MGPWGPWGREVHGRAPISAPDAQPLGRKRSRGVRAARLYRVQGQRQSQSPRRTALPFKPDISAAGTNCPNNQHPPNLLRASGSRSDAHRGPVPRATLRERSDTAAPPLTRHRQESAGLRERFAFFSPTLTTTTLKPLPLRIKKQSWRFNVFVSLTLSTEE